MSVGDNLPPFFSHDVLGLRRIPARGPLTVGQRVSMDNGPSSVRGESKGGMMEILTSLKREKRAVDDMAIVSPKSMRGGALGGFGEQPMIVDSMYTHYLECQHVQLQEHVDNVTMDMMKTKAEQTLKIINNHNEWAEHGYHNTANRGDIDQSPISASKEDSQWDRSEEGSRGKSDSSEDDMSFDKIARIGLDAPAMLVREKQHEGGRSSSTPLTAGPANKADIGQNIESSSSLPLSEGEGEGSEEPRDFRFPKNAVYVYKGFDRVTSQSIEDKVLTFNGSFESSNIDDVVYLGKDRYFITIRKDINSDLKQLYDRDLAELPQDQLNQLRKGKGKGWFMFEVSDLTPGVEYTFYIAGFRKSNSLFKHGMLPTYMYFIKQMKETITETGETITTGIDGLDDIMALFNDNTVIDGITFERGSSVFNGHEATMSCSYIPQYYNYKAHPISQTMARLVNPDGNQSMLKVVFKVPEVDLSLYKTKEENKDNQEVNDTKELSNKTSVERKVSFGRNSPSFNRRGHRDQPAGLGSSRLDETCDSSVNTTTTNKAVMRPSLSMILSLTFPYTYTMMRDMVDTFTSKMKSYGLQIEDRLRSFDIKAPVQAEQAEDSLDELINATKAAVVKDLSSDEEQLDLSNEIMEARKSLVGVESDIVVKQLCNDFGVVVPLIKIGRGNCRLFVMSRVHPSETPSSYITHGIINALVEWAKRDHIDGKISEVASRNKSFEKIEPNSEPLTLRTFLSAATLYIVPMVNCSGVICGNSRTNIMGTDLNRAWLSSSLSDTGTIYYIRKFLREISNEANTVDGNTLTDTAGVKQQQLREQDRLNTTNKNNNTGNLSARGTIHNHYNEDFAPRQLSRSSSADNIIDITKAQQPPSAVTQTPQITQSGIALFLDLHGHMKKPNIFIYGCSNPVDAEYFYNERLFPFILEAENTKDRSQWRRHTFHLSSCRYNVAATKLATSRVFVRRNLGVIHSYTLEASMGLFKDTGKCGTGLMYHLRPRDYMSMGGDILESLKRMVLCDFYEEAKRVKEEGDILKERLYGAGGTFFSKQQPKGPKKFVITNIDSIKAQADKIKKRLNSEPGLKSQADLPTSIQPSLNLVPSYTPGRKARKSVPPTRTTEEHSHSDSKAAQLGSVPLSTVVRQNPLSRQFPTTQKGQSYLTQACIILSPMKSVDQCVSTKSNPNTYNIYNTNNTNESGTPATEDLLRKRHIQGEQITSNVVTVKQQPDNKYIDTDTTTTTSSEPRQAKKVSLTYDIPLFDRAIDDPAFKRVNRLFVAAAVVARHDEEEAAKAQAEEERIRQQRKKQLKLKRQILLQQEDSNVAPESDNQAVAQMHQRKAVAAKRSKSISSGGMKRTKPSTPQRQARVGIPVAKQIISLPLLDIQPEERSSVPNFVIPSLHSRKRQRGGSRGNVFGDVGDGDAGRNRVMSLKVCNIGAMEVIQPIRKSQGTQGVVSTSTSTNINMNMNPDTGTGTAHGGVERRQQIYVKYNIGEYR